MRKTTGVWRRLLIVWAVMIGMWSGAGVAAPPYAPLPITLNAQDILPAALLQGENYRVVSQVNNDGLINTYQLETHYGPLTVEGTSMLTIRITELNALRSMEEMDRKKVFGKAVAEGAKAPIKGAAQMVTSPIETTKGIFKGTGRFLSNLGRSIISDDPHQSNALSVALGYDAARRGFAYEFSINPYSTYEPAMDRLGQIARAAVAGGVTTKAALAVIDHPAALAARISGTAKGMKKLVRDNPPGALKKLNEEKLEKMRLETALIEAFLDNHRYDPQEETLLVGALEAMDGVEGRDAFIATASVAAEESVAIGRRIMAQMMEAYHAHVAPVIRIRNDFGGLGLQKQDGGLVLLGPVDYIFWTEDVEQKLNALDSRIGKLTDISSKEMWITGQIDKAALEQFKAQGWKVTENALAVFVKE